MTLIGHFHLLGKLSALKKKHKTKANPVANKYIYVKSVRSSKREKMTGNPMILVVGIYLPLQGMSIEEPIYF